RGVVGPLSEKAMHYLERLDSDCHRMLATVNDILDLRQVENNTLVLTPSLSALSCIVEAAIDTLQVQSDSKRQLVLRDFGTKELFARCDVQKMERVMLNIIGNAIKFTPSNGTISLVIAEAPDNPHFALLTCRDTGMGIPADKLPHVSERYFRVGNFVKGTGLGLAITREIVELHQGKIQFASPVPGTDKGTEVCVRLPLVPAPTIVLGSPNETIRQQLEKGGYEVATVDIPKHLLETCLAKKAKAVVLFRNETSGYRETILQIRDDAKTKRMPILVLGKEELSYREATLFRQLAIVYCRSDQVTDTLPHCLAQAIGGRATKGSNDE
ncbi:MAG: HAMP domain-containing histidine kinase, partial [Kiritimatiellae bacterium]|nr:HAMP domain-containing histidine kinase [Kiritimatiellia bacterium]